MRAIKFRAYDTKEHKWMDEDWVINQSIWQLNADDSRYAWVQWTGLTDRNGVEIYEGDILRINESMTELDHEHAKVAFSKGYFGITDNDLEYEPLFLQSRLCEVIGNIYSNPELLKEAA